MIAETIAQATAAEVTAVPCESVQRSELLHVLTLTPFYPVQGNDGQGCFVAEPLPWLERSGVTNTAVAVRPFYKASAAMNDRAVPARWVPFFSFPSGVGLSSAGAFLFARILPQIERLHRQRSFHVIHAHSALPCGHAAALLSRELGIPFVVTVHGLDAFFTRQVGGYAGRWCARMASLAYREAANVICVSKKVREQVGSRLGHAVKTIVIYNGVDPEVFFPAEHDAESEVILTVGSLIGIKGHAVLLRAVARVQELRPAVRCEIIGEGPEQQRLEALCGDLGLGDKVRFLGRQSREQVAEAMRRCTVFALPSRYEGLGCVYLEAMCCGKAVIACRGQGIEEVIEAGINGWLVTPDDLQELTDALALLLRERALRREMGEAARNTILRAYTLEHQASRLSDTYRECLS